MVTLRRKILSAYRIEIVPDDPKVSLTNDLQLPL